MAARRSAARRRGTPATGRLAQASKASARTPQRAYFMAPTARMTWLLWREALFLWIVCVFAALSMSL